jgi:glycosyltransferase involved in cell wall biosynthesis
MNILLIAPQPFFEKRGTPLAVAVLAKALSELGHTIDLVTYHIGEPWSFPSVDHYRACRIPFISSVKKGLSAVKLFLDIFVFIKAASLLVKNHYDCIHGVEEGAMMGVVLKYFFKVKLVYDMDSSIPEQIIDSQSKIWCLPPFIKLANYFERLTICGADLVIAVCPALQERVVSIFPDKSVIVLEDIPVVEKAPSSMSNDMERIRSELSLGAAPCVVYTGTFESYQGIDLLLDTIPFVVRANQNVIFILVGGQSDQLGKVQCQVDKMGINQNVRVLGRRPMEEMPAFMALADVLVSPRTLGRNTPMKLYSYLQSGVPVVATRLLTHTQVLDDSVAVLSDATPDNFAAGIEVLLRDKALRSRLGAAAVEYVEKNFSYEAFKVKLQNGYEMLAIC